MDPVRKDFYENLYWEQLRLFKERLYRVVDRATIIAAYLVSAIILWQIRENSANLMVLPESQSFLTALVAGAVIWMTLLVHIFLPNLLPTLIEKIVLNREDKVTNLHKTLAFGSSHQDLKKLLAHPAVRFRKDRLGKTPLSYLCRIGHSELVLELTKDNKNLLNQVDKLGETPFLEALRSGQSSLVKSLLADGFIPKYRNGFTPLMTAALSNSVQDVENAYVRNQNGIANDGTTALHVAARAGRFDNLLYLLNKEADVQADLYTDHPINWSIARADEKSFEGLLRVKNILKYLDSENNSLMHKSVKYNWPHATQRLKESSTDLVSIKNAKRLTPLEQAQDEKKFQHVNLINGTHGNTVSASGSSTSSAPTSQGPTTAVSPTLATTSTSGNSTTAQYIDFDEIAVELQQELEGYQTGSYIADMFTSDLKSFHENTKSQFVLWTGTDLKNDFKKKCIDQINRRYRGYFPIFEYKAKDQDDAAAFFKGFENSSNYVDNSIIIVTGAENFFDLKEELVTTKEHKKIHNELEDFQDTRKLYFIFIADFAHRGETLTDTDMEELFGKALAKKVSHRFFDTAGERVFINQILPRYNQNSIRLEKPALAHLINYCFKNKLNPDQFFVFLRELPIKFSGQNITEYSLENVKTLLGQG